MKTKSFSLKTPMFFSLLLSVSITFNALGQTEWTTIPSTNNIYNTLQGNVGIGTTTPSRALSVYGPVAPGISITGPYSSTQAILTLGVATCNGCYSAIATQGDVVVSSFTQGSKHLILSAGNGNNGGVKFATGQAGSEVEQMTITSTGNIGMGLTAPTNKLELNGNFLVQRVQTGGAVNKFLINAGWQTNQNTFSITPQTSDGLSWNFNRDFILDQSGLMTKRIDNSLKTFNIYRMDLSQDVFRIMGDGKVYATELNIKLASQFPDYVFNPTYKLMPLKDLETYIEANHKLPNVPSAVQVENNGMDIGEMQKVQMEKIEELTLHLININKRMEQLEKENKELKEKQNQVAPSIK